MNLRTPAPINGGATFTKSNGAIYTADQAATAQFYSNEWNFFQLANTTDQDATVVLATGVTIKVLAGSATSTERLLVPSGAQYSVTFASAPGSGGFSINAFV